MAWGEYNRTCLGEVTLTKTCTSNWLIVLGPAYAVLLVRSQCISHPRSPALVLIGNEECNVACSILPSSIGCLWIAESCLRRAIGYWQGYVDYVAVTTKKVEESLQIVICTGYQCGSMCPLTGHETLWHHYLFCSKIFRMELVFVYCDDGKCCSCTVHLTTYEVSWKRCFGFSQTSNQVFWRTIFICHHSG